MNFVDLSFKICAICFVVFVLSACVMLVAWTISGLSKHATAEEKSEPVLPITPTQAPTPEPEPAPTEKPREKIELLATAYCSCEKCCGKWALNRPLDENGNEIVYTALGTIAKPNHTVAVDPLVIPWGTRLLINGIEYVAEDCGGAIKDYRIDIYFDSHEAALEFGIQKVTAEILGGD